MRLRSIVLYTTGNMHTSSPYHPRGASIFPFRRERVGTKENKIPTQREARHTIVQARKHSDSKRKEKRNPPSSPSVLHQALSSCSCDCFKFRNRRSLLQASLILKLRSVGVWVRSLQSEDGWCSLGRWRGGTGEVGGCFRVT